MQPSPDFLGAIGAETYVFSTVALAINYLLSQPCTILIHNAVRDVTVANPIYMIKWIQVGGLNIEVTDLMQDKDRCQFMYFNIGQSQYSCGMLRTSSSHEVIE